MRASGAMAWPYVLGIVKLIQFRHTHVAIIALASIIRRAKIHGHHPELIVDELYRGLLIWQGAAPSGGRTSRCT